MAENYKVFESVPRENIRYSAFDLSHEKKLTMQMGALVPVLLQEIVPGDQFAVKTEVMVRLAPTLYPVMHRINCYLHYFFVPTRQVWSSYDDFFTGGDSSGAITNPSMPQLTGTDKTQFYRGTVSDYFGIPTVESSDTISTNYDFISQLPFRAYHWIWNEYYRDQFSQTEYDPETDTADSDLCQIKYRCWERDYFTSCLPEVSRGGNTLISGSVSSLVAYKAAGTNGMMKGPSVTDDIRYAHNAGGEGHPETVTSSINLSIENIDSITNTLSVSVNDLRLAIATQKFWETAMHAGSRYTEVVRAHFGVLSDDLRLNRPEYLGGGKIPVVISEVLQTSETSTTPQGTMTGHGIAVGAEPSMSLQAKEHGYLIGIMSVLPRSAYQQGVPRLFLRDDRFDFYWPQFANLGEQIVENRELYFDATSGADAPTGTFGYQQRYAEYKYNPSTVHGDFRTSLDTFHMGRQFSAEPDLNEAFMKADLSPTSTEDGGITQRIFANTTETDHKLWVQLYHDVKAKRPMPFFPDMKIQ